MSRVLQNALLGLIAHRPMSGYELARKFERTLAHAWSAQHSQIYPELVRLNEQGLIHVSDEGARRRKTYAITESGLAAVRTWLAETEPDRGSRNEAVLRTFFLWLMDEREARQFLLEEIDHHARQLEAFEAVARDEDAEPELDDARFAGRLALEWGIRYERAYVEWARWAADQVAAGSRKRGWGELLRQVRSQARRRERATAKSQRTRT